MSGRLYTIQATEFDPAAGLTVLGVLAATEQHFIVKEWWVKFATTTSASIEVLVNRITALGGTFTQTLTARPHDRGDTAFGGTVKAQCTATTGTVDATDVFTERHHVNTLVGIHRKYADWNDDNGLLIPGNTGKGFDIVCVDDPAVNILVGCVIKEYF